MTQNAETKRVSIQPREQAQFQHAQYNNHPLISLVDSFKY